MAKFHNGLSLIFCCLAMFIATAMSQMATFDTNFVELDAGRMIQTSTGNFAITDPGFPPTWRAISVNGDEVTIATRDNKSQVKRLANLTPAERTSLNTIKATLMNVITMGPYNVKSNTSSKLTTFDRNGGTSTMGTGGGGSSSSSSSSSSSGGMSVSKSGPNSYIVSKPDFPYNWHRLFINDDLITITYRNGRVVMLPQAAMPPNEQNKLVEVRAEVDRSSKAAEDMTRSMTQSLGNPMDFVNSALGGMFGR